MAKLSVVIMAFNEEKKIAGCLESVKDVADEIVVIDNGSTDATVAIAKKYTTKVFKQKNDPAKIDLQKNFGFAKATGEWILSLDADERVSPQLTKEIQMVMDQVSTYNGYWIPRKNIIFGTWIQHTGWYPDNQLRLFKKGKGKYTSEHVHEHLEIEGTVGNLQEMIVHEHYQTVGEFLSKMLVYAPNEAKNTLDKGYEFSYLDAIRFPSREFISRFFAREGYKDGLHGLVLSLLMAFYHEVVFVYLWESKNYEVVSSDEFLSDVKKESVHIGRELAYWFTTESLKAAKGLEKITLKIKRKLSL
ncbi:MAG: glycosyltransferase family 2 protein [Patescibacteria group bacterium]|nr:glycosyltransferase family 2 protein [Patescibacteria group bacterium]MDE2590116.1 glycosyltransferase family 2 protein [Patescibacteria group bacterium]